jgi:hypothetical protein
VVGRSTFVNDVFSIEFTVNILPDGTAASTHGEKARHRLGATGRLDGRKLSHGRVPCCRTVRNTVNREECLFDETVAREVVDRPMAAEL